VSSSAPPRFDVVAKSNDWRGTVRSATTAPLSPAKQLQLDYWTAFRDYLTERASSFLPHRPQPRSWASVSIGRSGASLAAIASTWDPEHQWDGGENRVELGLNGDDAGDVYARLQNERKAIEEALGPLEWPQPDERTKWRRLYVSQPADIEDRDAWPEQFAWLEERLQRFDATFRERVKRR